MVSPSATLNNKDQGALLAAGGGGVGLLPAPATPEEEELLEISRQIVQKVLYSSRANINFVHEVLRQVSEGPRATAQLLGLWTERPGMDEL